MKIEYKRPWDDKRDATATFRISKKEVELRDLLLGRLNEGRYRYAQLSQADLFMYALQQLELSTRLEPVVLPGKQDDPDERP